VVFYQRWAFDLVAPGAQHHPWWLVLGAGSVSRSRIHAAPAMQHPPINDEVCQSGTHDRTPRLSTISAVSRTILDTVCGVLIGRRPE
jgi:hypothetical protein